MTYASGPFWWLTCDAPGCGIGSTAGAEIVAWREQEQAVADAEGSGWVTTDDDRHYCDDHRGYVCGECDKSEGHEYPLDHEGMCDECWAEEAKQNHGVVPA